VSSDFQISANSFFHKVSNHDVRRKNSPLRDNVARAGFIANRDLLPKEGADKSDLVTESKVMCKYCGTWFARRGIKSHVNAHLKHLITKSVEKSKATTDLKVQCKYCGMWYAANGIKAHVNAHLERLIAHCSLQHLIAKSEETTESKFKCKYCGMWFAACGSKAHVNACEVMHKVAIPVVKVKD